MPEGDGETILNLWEIKRVRAKGRQRWMYKRRKRLGLRRWKERGKEIRVRKREGEGRREKKGEI